MSEFIHILPVPKHEQTGCGNTACRGGVVRVLPVDRISGDLLRMSMVPEDRTCPLCKPAEPPPP